MSKIRGLVREVGVELLNGVFALVLGVYGCGARWCLFGGGVGGVLGARW
mgnify:CR=1 FL=1